MTGSTAAKGGENESMKCPGQDRRYWTGAAAVEVPCPECGAAVEVFRDESRGRCPRCGHRFANPGTDFGCAKWCSLAKECLGFAPERQSAAESGEGPLAARLLQMLEERLKKEPMRLAYALRVFQHAKDLVSKEGGDPRVVLTAALWLAADARGDQPAPSTGAGSMPGPPASAEAEAAAQRLGLDTYTWERVEAILDGYRSGAEPDTIEFRIVWDSHRLARLAQGSSNGGLAGVGIGIGERLKTEAGRRKAQSLLQPAAPSPQAEGLELTSNDGE